jgi:hypothetical protein
MTLQRTVDTLIEMDEPEALLATIRREAERKSGPRWQALLRVLDEAEMHLELILNAKPAGPDFRPDNEVSATENFHKPLDELVGRKPEAVNTDEAARSA